MSRKMILLAFALLLLLSICLRFESKVLSGTLNKDFAIMQQQRNIPPTDVDPIVQAPQWVGPLSGDGGRVSFADEYANALSVESISKPAYGQAGGTHHQYKDNWNATSSSGNSAVYPNITKFTLNNLEFGKTREDDDWNYFEYKYGNPPNNVTIQIWIFAGMDSPDNTGWLQNCNDNTGFGYADPFNDVGFLVRKDFIQANDAHWLPGQPEPGDPLFNWTDYHGVFASSGFDNSAFAIGDLPFSENDDNELYEVAIRSVIPNQPFEECWTMGEKEVDPKNGVGKLVPWPVFDGSLHIGVPGGMRADISMAMTGEPETLDPAWCYDTTSGQIINNVYDTLIRFDGKSTDEFVPSLATELTIDYNILTYMFTIRDGVEWHDSAYETVTPKDVEYSFERWMVQDRSYGPTWMILEPLLGVNHLSDLGDLTDPTDLAMIGQMIDDAVEVVGDEVIFHLSTPYEPFLSIIAQPWASILCEQWCIDHDDFPGFDDTGYTNWVNYHDPEFSPLDYPDPVMMGTGPYMLDYWEKGVEYSLIKFNDYWGGWPAYNPETETTCRGYLTRATVKNIAEWSSMKQMFLDGDLDIIDAPIQDAYEIFGQPGVSCVYPLLELSCGPVLFFNYEVASTSPYVTLPPGTIDESGIPPDFFYDINVRKAFAYSFDYYTYIDDAYWGEASLCPTCVVDGLPYRNPDQEGYCYDLSMVEEHFRTAWDGELWDTGFTMSICYYSGSEKMRIACEILEINIESLNPKFHIDVIEVDGNNYLRQWIYHEFALLIHGGWIADFPDPHNFVHPFMNPQDSFLDYQGVVYGQYYNIDNLYVASLIEAGIEAADPTERETIYYELQAIYHDEVPSVPLCQQYGRHWERDWVQGWNYNPILPGNYFYHLWKEELPLEDIDDSGSADIFDVVLMAKAFGSYYASGDVHPDWDSRADLNQDRVVDIFDVVMIAKMFGYTAPPWTPP